MASEEKNLAPAAYTTITEQSIKEALIEARGDIFIAGQLLQVTAIRIQRAIQVSAVLQATQDAIPKISKGLPLEQLRDAVEQRLTLYRVVGLDALHDLAAMPIDANSAQNQVKLAAAARLAGETASAGGSGEFEATLRELNQAYQQTAPRLRVIREKTTIETIPAERIVGSGEPE